MLTIVEARNALQRILEHSGPSLLVILDEATVERDFGWVFVLNSRRFAESHKWEDMLFGLGPILIDRFDGSIHEFSSAYPAEAAADEYMRRLRPQFLGRFCGWLRGVPLPIPRSEPRFPSTVDQARRIYRRWDALNGRYFFRADVALLSGMILCDVIFDSNTNIAVEVKDRPLTDHPTLIGAVIRAFLRIEDPGRPLRATEADRSEFADKYR